MNIGGFVRTLQSSFTSLLVTLIVIGTLTALGFVLTKQLEDVDEVELWRTRILLGTRITSALALIVFLANAMITGFTDRMPRSDVDKQPVYDQMNSH